MGLKQLLATNDEELIKRKTEEKYIDDLNAGDVDYAVVILVPCLIGEPVFFNGTSYNKKQIYKIKKIQFSYNTT